MTTKDLEPPVPRNDTVVFVSYSILWKQGNTTFLNTETRLARQFWNLSEIQELEHRLAAIHAGSVSVKILYYRFLRFEPHLEPPDLHAFILGD